MPYPPPRDMFSHASEREDTTLCLDGRQERSVKVKAHPVVLAPKLWVVAGGRQVGHKLGRSCAWKRVPVYASIELVRLKG